MSNSISINNISSLSAGKKMNFSQTCNLLSQFVKEKRALGVSSEGYDRSTMNLFPLKQVDDSNVSVGRTINLFPQISGFDSSMNERATSEPSATQMTIFYGGQVVVFNDLPTDKAKEVINLASSFESSLKKMKVETPIPAQVFFPSAKPIISQNPSLNPNLSQPNSHNLVMRNSIPTADLPIARKASLHCFREKRKDRLVGKAPESTNILDKGADAVKPVERKPSLGLNSLPIFQQKQ